MNVLNYEVIFFDIFDTLVKRKTGAPADLFELIENQLVEKFNDGYEFKKKRVAAKEKIKTIDKYYSINDLYSYIELPTEMADLCLEMEKQMEIEACYPNTEIINLFNRAVSNGKRVFIVSDMYLDRKTIESMLKKCGVFGYKQLYISQEEHATKSSGELFRKIIKDNSLQSKKILHIGDDLKGDFLMPLIHGIVPHKLDTDYIDVDYNSNSGLAHSECAEYKWIQNIVNSTCVNTSDVWQKLGAELLGPILYGFSNWLANELEQAGIKRVFFLAREGRILKKSFEKLYPDRFDCKYLYVSRHSLTVPSFSSYGSFEEIVKDISFPKNITFIDFLEYIGVDYETIVDIAHDCEIEKDTVLEGWNVIDNQKLKQFFEKISDIAFNNYKEQKGLLDTYLDQNLFLGDVAIVDVGWNGTMQKALEGICINRDVKIKGFYFGINENNKLSQESFARGYIYDKKYNSDYQYYIMGMSGPLEMIMTADHGTTIKYKNCDNGVMPVLAESEYFGQSEKPEALIIESVQKGALAFVENVESIPGMRDKSITGLVAFHNFFLFGKKPVKKHRKMFDGLKEYDSTVELVMLNHSLHGIKDTIKGFWNSSWKIGYMYDRLPCFIPYEKVYKWMRKRK